MFQLHVFDPARTLVPVPTLTPTNFVVYDIDHQPLPRMYGLSLFRSNDVTSPKYTKVVQGTVEQCQTFSHSYKSLRPPDCFKPGMNRMYGNCFVGFLQDYERRRKLRSFRLSWEAPVSNDCRFRNWTVEAWVLAGSGEPAKD